MKNDMKVDHELSLICHAGYYYPLPLLSAIPFNYSLRFFPYTQTLIILYHFYSYIVYNLYINHLKYFIF